MFIHIKKKERKEMCVNKKEDGFQKKQREREISQINIGQSIG